MRYIRWMGAFRAGAASLEEAAAWEVSQGSREVAVEPLVRGRSRLLAEANRSLIGLEIDVEASHFVAGFYRDCWSEPCPETGRLTSGSRPDERREWAFAKKLARATVDLHAEAWFARPTFKAVVVDTSVSKRVHRRASQLAKQLGLPLVRF